MQKELYNRIWTMIDHTILGSMVDFSESPDPYGELCLWEDDTFLSNCLYYIQDTEEHIIYEDFRQSVWEIQKQAKSDLKEMLRFFPSFDIPFNRWEDKLAELITKLIQIYKKQYYEIMLNYVNNRKTQNRIIRKINEL